MKAFATIPDRVVNFVKGSLRATPDGAFRLALGFSLLFTAAFALRAETIFDFSPHYEAAISQDYTAFYVAAQATAQGEADQLYDVSAFRARIGYETGLLWLYPPTILPLLAPFGVIPYGAAKAVWLALGFAALALGGALAGRGEKLMGIITAVSPAAWALAFTGQLSALFAFAMLVGLLCAKTRPVIAGVCIGLLTLKPQFGALVPVFLIAVGAWRTAAVAALTALGLIVAAVSFVGIGSFEEFLRSLGGTHTHFAAMGGNPGRITLNESLSFLGISVPSLIACTPPLLAAAGCILLLARRGAPLALLAAFVMLSTCATSPYFWNYDFVIVVFALLLLATHVDHFAKPTHFLFTGLWFAPLLPYAFSQPFFTPWLWFLLVAATVISFRMAAAGASHNSHDAEARRLLRFSIQSSSS